MTEGGVTLSQKRGVKIFELSNHLGNVLVTVSDRRVEHNTSGTTIDYYEASVVSASDYYPFGMGMASRSFSNASSYRYGFNGQEKSLEIDANGNSMTALFWQYDARIGRRWNTDPKAVPSQNPFATLNNNPIWHIDPLGDSSVIDNRGYIVYYDKNDKDLRVFMQQDGKLTPIGTLGGTIDANGWLGNLLTDNSKRADDIYNPITFKNFVKKNGRWDYKSLNESNKRVRKGELKAHIIGIAFYRKDKETNPSGANPKEDTRFLFSGEFRLGITYSGYNPRAEDINNFHFGVVGKATGLFGETTMLRIVGEIEMAKAAEKGQQVPKEWRPQVGFEFTRGDDGKGGIKPKLGPPYGDNPDDHEWIKRGFKYYDRNKKKLDGE